MVLRCFRMFWRSPFFEETTMFQLFWIDFEIVTTVSQGNCPMALFHFISGRRSIDKYPDNRATWAKSPLSYMIE